jgi:predicted alpha-1,6-mannanase (GH76 family)
MASESGAEANRRAASAEHAVVGRYVRGLPWIAWGRSAWPPLPALGRAPEGRARWHYWWSAHLVDAAIDAVRHRPQPARRRRARALVRGTRVRNGGTWSRTFFDDLAWLGLALERGADVVGHRRTTARISARLEAAIDPDVGAVPWRVGDRLFNAPANGPAAILLARTGDVERAAEITDWMADTLLDEAGLVIDGVRPGERATTTYTYCQGVYLGACVELAQRHGDPRWRERAEAVLAATAAGLAEPDGVVRGYDDGGDGGLFNGILARYLADAAVRLPDLPHARDLVLASAESVWEHRSDGPVFAHDWRRPARPLAPQTPEADLSVQLSAWMLLEAAARVSGAGGARPAG